MHTVGCVVDNEVCVKVFIKYVFAFVKLTLRLSTILYFVCTAVCSFETIAVCL